jgi:hypothetical protein
MVRNTDATQPPLRLRALALSLSNLSSQKNITHTHKTSQKKNESSIMDHDQHYQRQLGDYNDYYYDNRMDDENDSNVYEQQQQLPYPQEEQHSAATTTTIEAISGSSITEEHDYFSSSTTSWMLYDRASAGVAYIRGHYFAILITILVVVYVQFKGN